VQSDVLSVEEIQAVLSDLESNEPWYYPLFLLWLSTGLRNAEIRGLTWDCIRWEEGEVLVWPHPHNSNARPHPSHSYSHQDLLSTPPILLRPPRRAGRPRA